MDIEAIFGGKAGSGVSEAKSSSHPVEAVPIPDANGPPSPEYDRLLTQLRNEVARIEWEFGGSLPIPLAHVLVDAVLIAEGYVANHQAEAERGWNVLHLLRGMVPHVRRCVVNWKAMNDKK